jgi:ABC-2 type transport system ATP-binding protein
MVHDPEVLLLDEPASGLDPRARVEMRELLRELGAMGKTIILSSHILVELAELCDSIAIIEKGRLVTSGLLSEIRAKAQGNKRIRIQILSPLEEAIQILSSYSGVGDVVPPSADAPIPGLEFNFSGNNEAGADLLEYLVAHKVRPFIFEEIDTGLEELFLQLTKGEVA